ncbi:hypothetical protein TruAng_000677 [Truncatella angustata]|nr:hypothetical protein TruAng_000677 [Truncatella angustata]
MVSDNLALSHHYNNYQITPSYILALLIIKPRHRSQIDTSIQSITIHRTSVPTMVRSNILISSFGFLAISSALPTTTESSGLQSRAYRECALNTSYFKCGIYDGCFASDPCIVPPTESIPPTQTTCKNSTTTKDQRVMYVVAPLESDTRTKTTVPHFQVISGDMDVNEVGVFTGIPADAKSCSLGWHQGDANKRTFKVTGNGLVSAWQLDDLNTKDGVSWSDVKSAKTVGKEAGPDFTSWDLPEYGSTNHGSWSLDCRETIYIKFETLKVPADSDSKEYRNVYMDQDENNGFYVRYEC